MRQDNIFKGKTAVITGASTGIGFGLSKRLLEHGAHVWLSSRTPANVKAAQDKLAEFEDRAHFDVIDVSDADQVTNYINAIAGKGRIDYLFNNAGIGWGAPIRTANLETWRRIIDTNLWGVINGVDAVLPIMSRQGSGHIVNTASILGLIPGVYQSIYSATKYAVVGLSEALRYELASDGILVSAVCPGAVATNIFPEGATPSHAISPEVAATIILHGVAQHKGIIPVGEDAEKLWSGFRSSPEDFEKFIQDLTLEYKRHFSENVIIE